MLGLGAHRVFVDSNVLYSRTLRDWLALIYLQGEQPPYAVYWTEDVLAELVYHLRRQHPDWNGGKISAIRDRLTKVFEVGRVADYPVAHAEAVRDKYDLHIHAAALAFGADILLTSNVRDLPSAEQYDVMKPDEFFVLVDELLAAWHQARTGLALTRFVDALVLAETERSLGNPGRELARRRPCPVDSLVATAPSGAHCLDS